MGTKLKPFDHTINGTNETAQGYMFRCPGCKDFHSIFVKPNLSPAGAGWDFNGDVEKPTFSPSILSQFTRRLTDEQANLILAGGKFEPEKMVCHSFVTDGEIRFLDDCTHDLKGQTVELSDWDDTALVGGHLVAGDLDEPVRIVQIVKLVRWGVVTEPDIDESAKLAAIVLQNKANQYIQVLNSGTLSRWVRLSDIQMYGLTEDHCKPLSWSVNDL